MKKQSKTANSNVISAKKDLLDETFKLVANKLNEHKITWWLFAGSLLGAVREGKRVEWDYDYSSQDYPKDYTGNQNIHFSVIL